MPHIKPGQPISPSSPGVQTPGSGPVTYESVIPNPKAKLLDQIREVMRLKHYSIRTERTYCEWVRRYVHYHQMHGREEMFPAEQEELRTSNAQRRTSNLGNGSVRDSELNV